MRLTVDLTTRHIEVEGDDDFVKSVYADLKQQLCNTEEVPGATPVARSDGSLNDLIEEARISAAWQEPHRSYTLLKRAMDQLPQNANPTIVAEILEGLDGMSAVLQSTECELLEIQAALECDPENAEKRFYLALTLSKLGRASESFALYESALSNPAGLCEECFRDLWNNIGWFYFRRKDFREALKWFEQSYQVALADEETSVGKCALAIENKIQCYSALTLSEEAVASAQEYIRRYGRLPWPERRVLARIGVDADALYVQHRMDQFKNELAP